MSCVVNLTERLNRPRTIHLHKDDGFPANKPGWSVSEFGTGGGCIIADCVPYHEAKRAFDRALRWWSDSLDNVTLERRGFGIVARINGDPR